MANEVFANGREISCKSGDGKVIAATPDVCFTPPENPATPPGVPVPYPISSFSSDNTEGTKNVQISGKEVMLRNISYFSKCTGDEAGCAAKKGVVTSSNTSKTYFKSWSMDVKFEGENVVRHLDLTTSNHRSEAGNASVPQVETESGAASESEECSHPRLIRNPEKDTYHPEPPAEAERRRLNRREKYLDKLLAKAAEAERSGNLPRAQFFLDQAMDLDETVTGKRFEVKVAEQTNAKECSVKITCQVCGKVVREFDVVTEDGIVKECKASWQQVNETQFTAETALAQRADVFGPGTTVHIAIPRGQRGRLDRKFTNKAAVAGKIQEH